MFCSQSITYTKNGFLTQGIMNHWFTIKSKHSVSVEIKHDVTITLLLEFLSLS